MNGPLGLAHGAPLKAFEERQRLGYLPRGWIDGLILSNDTTDVTNDISISAGCARSTASVVDGVWSAEDRDQLDLELPVGIIKQLDVAWAPANFRSDIWPVQGGGDRSGGRSISSLSNTWWHMYLVGARSVPADVLFHDDTASIAAAVEKTGYSAYRRIGAVRRVDAILPFIQRQDEFFFATVPAVTSSSPGSTAGVLVALWTPAGVRTEAIMNVDVTRTSASVGVYVSSPDINDQAASPTATPLSSVGGGYTGSTVADAQGYVRCWTDASSQVRIGVQAAGSVTARLATLGYRDPRGRNA